VVNNQFALFGNGLTDGVEMESGLVMASGPASTFMGDAPPFEALTNPITNDVDMMALSGQTVNDCAIIEFDVLVEADALAFSFLFGSMEYFGYTCSSFNDAFGLFISGPGIDGPYSNNSINIATIPDSDVPVAINTVNSGQASFIGNAVNCEAANPNWQQDTIYFIDNTANLNSNMMNTGYTVSIEAYVDVVFGETYHMKLGVCDADDTSLDSGVLLEAGSFEGRLAGPTSTSDADADSFVIFPNPSAEWLRIRAACKACTGPIDVQIKDLNGRQVDRFNADLALETEFSVSDLVPGMYIIEIRDGQELLKVSKFLRSAN
jgi:hypothetical protein